MTFRNTVLRGLFYLTFVSLQLSASWSSPPTQISQDMGSFPMVKKDTLGNAIAVWWSTVANKIQSARLPVNAVAWTAPVNIAATSGIIFESSRISMAISNAGDAVVVWVDDNQVMSAVSYSAATDTWSPTTNLPAATVASLPVVAFSGNGDAIAAWLQTAGSTVEILSARLASNSTSWDNSQVIYSTFYEPTLIEVIGDEILISPGSGIEALSIATGADKAVIAWSDLSDVSLTVKGATFSGGASGSWSLTSPLSNAGGFFIFLPNRIGIAVGSTEKVLALWSFLGDSSLIPQGSSQQLGGPSWLSTTFPDNPSGVNTLTPQVAIDAAGNAYALLFQEQTAIPPFQSPLYSGFFTVLTLPAAGQVWIPLFSSPLLSNTSSIPQLAVNSSGQGVVAYEDDSVIKVVEFTNNSSSFTPITLSLLGTNQGVQIAVDSLGNGVAVWNELEGGQVFATAGTQLFPPLPPASFSGEVVENRFLLQTDRIHRLQWQPSPDPSVTNYELYRNGKKVAVIPTKGPYWYSDHDRSSRVKDVYRLYAVNSAGSQSTFLQIALQ